MESPPPPDRQRAAPPQPISPTEAVRLGLRALNERTEVQALPILSEVWRRHPAEAALCHMLGLLHFELGQYEPAFAAMDTAIALKPNDARLMHARARMALDAGLPSLEWFDRARRLAPDDAGILLGHIASQAASGRAQEADGDLTNILRQHPGWIDGHAALMRLRFSLGRVTDWQSELDRTLDGHPGDPRLHYLKIIALYRAHRTDEAREAVSVALRLASQFPQIRAAAAIIATEYGRPDEAEGAFHGLDKLADADLALHWCRLLVRQGAWRQLLEFTQKIHDDRIRPLFPYISIAMRNLDSQGTGPGDAAYVKIIDFDPGQVSLAELTKLLRTLHLTRAQPLDQSVRGGTQTDGPLLRRAEPVIQELRARLMTEVRAYIAALPVPDSRHMFLSRVPREPRFSGSWSVRITHGGHHDPHVHDHGWLSSVFYVGVTSTDRESMGMLTLGEPQKSLKTGLPPLLTVEPAEGRLVLFPSHLWHGTKEFEGEERLTLAFDVA